MIDTPGNETRGATVVAARRPLVSVEQAAMALAAVVVALFLLLPLVAIVLKTFQSSEAMQAFGRSGVTEALRLSLTTSAVSTGLAVALGTPLAYALARYRFPGRAALDTLVDLPIVLPPAVAGLGLLMAFGRRGILGDALDLAGLHLAFTTTAVVMAQTFVASPFYIRSARAGFESVDRSLEAVSATLGASPLATFFRVTAPLARPALAGGAAMAWARALGEFGATIMFAGNLPGVTQTMPLAIYSDLQGGDLRAALALAVILLIVSFTVLLLFRLLTGRARDVYA